MILNKKYFAVYFSFFLSAISFSQDVKEVKKDTTTTQKLEEVVVTAQHNPQSVNKSIYDVKVIKKEEIKQRAVTNLADLLNQTLNIVVMPNTSSGRSEVSLFGLDGGYFKVLIDNVPVINEKGFGNYADLDLINTDDIEQIEIVEGAMGVQYGSNALTGVINIITKKSSKNKTDINVYVQEETVSSEYEWFEKGRHIQSATIGHNFTDHIFANLSYVRNDFGGYWQDHQGPYYDEDDGLRGHEWLPKEIQNSKFLIQYHKDNFKVFYKFDYLNEHIYNYSKSVLPNDNSATDTSDPVALDEEFFNDRFIHHLNLNGHLGRVYFDVAASYQKQDKDIETYTYRIREDEKLNRVKREYSSRKALFSRGTFSNIIQEGNFNLQLGYEINSIEGYGSPDSFNTSSQTDGSAKNKLDSYDFFASSEISLTDKLSLRPGIRMSYSNLFSPKPYYSLSSKYRTHTNWQLRAVIGFGGRIPNYDELFTYFVDVNHNVQGNQNLDPENGYSLTASIKKNFLVNDDFVLKSSFSAQYLDIEDRISLIVVNEEPLESKYHNIDRHRNIAINFKNQIQYKHIDFSLGASVFWTSRTLKRNGIEVEDDFLFSSNLNSSLGYHIPKWNSRIYLNYKLTGAQEQFALATDTSGEGYFKKGKVNAFDFLDASIRTTFLNETLETVIGVRNITDRRSRQGNITTGGAHTAGTTSTSLAYGRSYFLKLAYNLNL